MAETQVAPRVTPFLLQRADTMCGRRLARAFEGGERSHDPVHRSRLRDAFLAAARDAHAELRVPTAADFDGMGAALRPELLPEEQAVLAQAAHWYVQIFAARPARWDDPGTDQPTERRGVRVGGWIDLPRAHRRRRSRAAAGRALGPPGGAARAARPARAADRVPAAHALARRQARCAWSGSTSSAASCGSRSSNRTPAPRSPSGSTRRLAIVLDRAAEPTTTPGDDCGTCAVVAACPEHRKGAHYGRRRDLLPGILHVTPTNLDTWRRCPREWRNACLFGIPSSDTDPGTVHGQQMHDVLRLVHERGTCRDDAHVDDVLVSHGFGDDERMRAELARHTASLPDPADALGHEVTRARFGPHPTAPFMATARLDALWVHDGILDARDYKTGRVWTDRVADDSQARLQAWVVAPLAERLGLRLRITFEHLATEVLDDPEPFEPDADDLRAIEDELRCEVVAIRSEVDFAGVADADVCHRCRYRSICPDSAVTGVPVWPVVEHEEEAG